MKRILLPSFARSVKVARPVALLLLFSICCCASFAEGQDTELQPAVAEAFGLTKGQIVTLDLPAEPTNVVRQPISIDGKDYVFELFPHSVRSPKYVVREQVAEGEYITREPTPPRTVRGSMVGNKGSRVFGSINENGLSARIRMGDGEVMYIEPLASRVKGLQPEFEAQQHVVYSGADTVPNASTCGVLGAQHDVFDRIRMAELRRQDLERGSAQNNNDDSGQPGPDGPPEGPEPDSVAELALDTDFEYFSDFGSVEATINRMELIINIVNDQYESDVDITHQISGIVVRSTSVDPYTSDAAQILLGQFQNEWLTNQQAIQRDVAHLFTGRTIDGSTIGIAAAIGGICTNSAFCLSQSDFNGALVCATDLTAHELGHLWNGSHCNCPNQTMNPSITCTNVFNQTFTVPDIVSHRNSRNCLTISTDPPQNDAFESKLPLGSLPASVTGSNINGTVQAGEQQLEDTGATVWWFVNAPGDGIMSVDTFGSNFDTQLHIFTGSENGFTNLQPLINSDDVNGTAQSAISFPVVAGERYEIRVGGFQNDGDPATGLVQVNASFVAQGPTDFFFSDRSIASGADNDSNEETNFITGTSGSVYLYYDPTMSDIDTGAFFDISTSQPGIIEFTNAETLEFDILVGDAFTGVRWGDAVGETGSVSANFIDELGAINVVAGNGMLAQNTGPTFVDQGYDFEAGAFVFARIDFNVIGPAGSSVDIIANSGVTGIVNMGSSVDSGIGAITINVMDELPPESDFFWSVAGLNEGAFNDSMAPAVFSEGDSGSMYLYYDTAMSELDTGGFIDIQTSTNGVIEFTNATTLDFDITAGGAPFSVRWGDAVGETGDVMPNAIEGLGAFTILEGTGILNQNTGPVFLDQGYDMSADAFLFARIDFDVVGSPGDMVDVTVSSGDQGIVHDGSLVEPIFGMASLMISEGLLGDINCDGAVTLLDVGPFVDLISSGEFSSKGDFNGDGVITLLDIQGFVDALSGG